MWKNKGRFKIKEMKIVLIQQDAAGSKFISKRMEEFGKKIVEISFS